MSAPNYRGVAPPLINGEAVYDVVAAERVNLLDLTFLDAMFYGVPCHWVIDPNTKRGRSRLCTLFEGDCHYHDSGMPEVWLGFAAVFNHHARRRDVFRCGAEGAKCVVKYSAKMGGLAGVRLTIRLATNGRTSGLVVTPSEAGPMLPLMRPHRIEPTIKLVLGCKTLPGETFSRDEIMGMGLSDEQGGV